MSVDNLEGIVTHDAALQYFEENLPRRPYHTDDPLLVFASPAKGVRCLRGTSSEPASCAVLAGF